MAPARRMGELMTAKDISTRKSVSPQHMRDLKEFSLALITLSEQAPDRLTIAQLTFFIAAALADLRGSPATFTEIFEVIGDQINKSLRTTYKVFLDVRPRKDRPNNAPGVGWLHRVTNPKDEREKFLKLTPKGKFVVEQLLFTMEKARARDAAKESA